jgi:2-succinyl-5-enolpyruvyl-6-hydroxy-3-cyclohexene-1-carboxylate synthase
MGIAATTIASQSELITELSKPITGLSVVVINAPDRNTNADFLKGIYNNISSM